MQNKNFIFSDLDGTITPPRQKIEPHIKEELLKLNKPLIVISGLPKHEIIDHLDGVPAIILGQQGNDAPEWQNILTEKEFEEVKSYTETFKEYWELFNDKQETLQNRGGLIAFSFTGHFAPKEYKSRFDKDRLYRKWVLERFPFQSETLTVGISGSTTLDFTRKNWKKGDNIKRYLELHNIDPKDCVYFGDSLFPEGNDFSVVGVMECQEVVSPDDFINKLKDYV